MNWADTDRYFYSPIVKEYYGPSNVYHQGSSPDEGDLGPWYPSSGGDSSMGWMAAATALGAASSYFGQKSANRANAAMAQKQMDFQREMSGTAYQRAVADMKKAGINPMLAAKTGGASTPSGSTAVIQNTGKAAAEGAFSAAQNYRMRKLMDLEVDKFVQEVKNMRTMDKVNNAEASLRESEAEGWKRIDEMIEKMGAEEGGSKGTGNAMRVLMQLIRGMK